ncbi:hypothetical protein LPJ59_001561 [Coemansia sp. RSA 2399]|nr:hypothetical protein LPJ59_001561 [Coemansia sp. RSA 2399]
MWWRIHDNHVSMWRPEVGEYNQTTALSLGEMFSYKTPDTGDMQTECDKPDSGLSKTVSSLQPLHMPHSTDKAWKKEGGDCSTIETRSDDDNWVTFTPAPDFVLDPKFPGPK